MSEVTPETIREQLAQAEKAKDELKSFERLLSNRDFKKFILDDFIVTNAARQVGNSIDVNFEDDDARRYALGEAQSAGYLKRWLQAQKGMFRQRINDIPNLEHTLRLQEAEDSSAGSGELGLDADDQE